MTSDHRETELKFRLIDRDGLERSLEKHGAVKFSDTMVRTSSFDFLDKRLRADRVTVRIREDNSGVVMTTKTAVSSKKEEEAGLPKIRLELNLSIASAVDGTLGALSPWDAACQYLRNLGMVETLTYVKHRMSWRLPVDGKTLRVDLDGLFENQRFYVELEGAEPLIQTAMGILGLERSHIETRSFYAIVQAGMDE